MDLQQIGEELAVKWENGEETYIPLKKLRRCCPCAGCKGEMDIMGNVYRGPEQQLTERSYQLKRVDMIGGYAVQPVWGDGHATGLFTFDYLRAVGGAPDQ